MKKQISPTPLALSFLGQATGTLVDSSANYDALWGLDAKLLDLLPIAVYFCNARGTLLQWNRRAVELWGREPEAGDMDQRFCGSFMLFYADGTPMSHAECPVAEALHTGQPQCVEAIVGRPDGSRRYITATIDPIRNNSGAIVGAVNVLHDITDRKLSELAVANLERRFGKLLEKLPAAAYTCEPSGLITYYNERAVELWGRAPKLNDPVDRFCGSFLLFSADGISIKHDECWMALALQNRSEYLGKEIIVQRPDGSRRSVLAYATPFFEQGENIAGAVNVLVDVTERQEAQNRINDLLANEKVQSDRLREADRRKDEFLAMLAHELRNPLAPIRIGLDILAMESADPNDTVHLMQEQIEHLIRLVDDLMDISRIMQGKIEVRLDPVELGSLVKRCVQAAQPLIDCNQQKLVVTLPDSPVWLNADAIRLMQVFENLLNNAAKYTPARGKIALSAECQGEEVVISIRDDGIGMDQEFLPYVFDLFAQASRSLDRSQGGLGIGLTLVHRLVELHGGTVSAYSDGLGLGSTFTTRLPLGTVPADKGKFREQTRPATSRRILIVDDNRSARWLLSRLLTKLGDHEIDLAEDGYAALEKIRAFHPEIVILDIGLPGIDGFKVGRTIRKDPRFDNVLLIAMTGYGRDEDRQASMEAGFDEHLVKPPSVQQIQFILSHPKLK